MSNWLGDLCPQSVWLVIWSLEWLSLWDGCAWKMGPDVRFISHGGGKNGIPVCHCLVSLVLGNLRFQAVTGNGNPSFWTRKDWLRKRYQTDNPANVPPALTAKAWWPSVAHALHPISLYSPMVVRVLPSCCDIWHVVNEICYMIILSRCLQILHRVLSLVRWPEVAWVTGMGRVLLKGYRKRTVKLPAWEHVDSVSQPWLSLVIILDREGRVRLWGHFYFIFQAY